MPANVINARENAIARHVIRARRSPVNAASQRNAATRANALKINSN